MSILGNVKARVKRFIEAEVDRQVAGRSDQPLYVSSAVAQKVLMMELISAAVEQRHFSFGDVGFSEHSQVDEDGILLYIFALAGVESRTCVEICAGDGTECNTANLILNHGWHGLLVDGNAALIEKGREFYRNHKNTYVYPPKLLSSWVTRENVNQMLADAGFTGSVDLLSLDMDGVDYWILDAISVITPRVIVLEYQDILGPERSWTVPYSPDFDKSKFPHTARMPNYCGASLMAFKKLLEQRGYRLVGTNRLQYNAFFIRNPIAMEHFPCVTVESCFTHEKVRWGMAKRFPSIEDFPWVAV